MSKNYILRTASGAAVPEGWPYLLGRFPRGRVAATPVAVAAAPTPANPPPVVPAPPKRTSSTGKTRCTR